MAHSIIIAFYGNNDPDIFVKRYLPSNFDYRRINSKTEVLPEVIDAILFSNGVMLMREEIYWLQSGQGKEEADALFEAIITKEMTKYPNGFIVVEIYL